MTTDNQHKRIVFTPSGLSHSVDKDSTILAAAHDTGVAIRSLCGGNGRCHQCWVEISEGHHSKHKINCSSESVSDLSSVEQAIIKENPRYKGKRLACQTRILSDVVVDVPEVSQEHLAYISKKNTYQDYVINPAIKLIDITLSEATLDHNPSASENVLDQLKSYNINATFNHRLLPVLQPLIAETGGRLTVALRDDKEVVALYPSQEGLTIIGGGVDIGSTTLALYVHNLITGELLYETSAMNPQIRFGEDLMSRVSYVMLNKDGDKKLTKAVQDKLTEMVHEACSALGLTHDKLLELVLVGNPIMHHLFFGISPVELGQAPFTVATRDWIEVSPVFLDMDLFVNTRISFLPLIAGHVGADNAAAYLSQLDVMKHQTTLLVDIGTNAEIMLAKDGVVYATSSPTGPAFEGAEISSGVRASHGAIERVRIDDKTLQVKYRLIGNEYWSDDERFTSQKHRAIGICGSGIIEAIVSLARVGLIDKSGLFVTDKAPERFSKRGNTSRFLLVDNDDNPIYIEQVDIRSIQLAKAALSAGVHLLMDYLDCKGFEQVLLAGAFGAHLDPEYVADLDIIPTATTSQIKSVGNAAGIGAVKTLLDVSNRDKIIAEVRKVHKIESANEPNFQQYFVEGMQFSVAPDAVSKQTNKRRRRRG